MTETDGQRAGGEHLEAGMCVCVWVCWFSVIVRSFCPKNFQKKKIGPAWILEEFLG